MPALGDVMRVAAFRGQPASSSYGFPLIRSPDPSPQPLSRARATIFTHLRPAATSARRRQAASRLLRCASPASPGRTLRVRLEVTAPSRWGEAHPWSLLREAGLEGRLLAAKTMETKSLSRAQGSMFASAASNPRSGPDIDPEHGSGTADPEDREFGRVNPIAQAGEGFAARPLLPLSRENAAP